MKLALISISLVTLASCRTTQSDSNVEGARPGPVTGGLFPKKTAVYQCDGVAGVEEWRAHVDLKKGAASFFDNDSTTDMKIKSSNSSQTLFVFEGKDASQGGTLRLTLNLISGANKIDIVSVAKSGASTDVGSAKCVQTSK